MELSAHFGLINVSPPKEVPAEGIRASPAVQVSRARYCSRTPAQGNPAALRGSVQTQSSLQVGHGVLFGDPLGRQPSAGKASVSSPSP